MPSSERLRLASLILNDLAPAESLIDESDEWSDEDLVDATKASLDGLNRQSRESNANGG
jgi:hypothetical protein